jgi:hypothetical protein
MADGGDEKWIETTARIDTGREAMVTTKGQLDQQRRVLFARVGWMRFYSGPVPGDERPRGGGRYTKSEIGHEVHNFRGIDGRLYGYFQPTMSSPAIALERIDPEAADKGKLGGVLVVFVARRPEGGQVIVGWYKNSEVLRINLRQSPGKPRGYGHYCSAERPGCVLLPNENRSFHIPSGKGGMGQSNVCYPLARDGSQKKVAWIQDALGFIDDYQAGNILAKPEEAAEKESVAAAEEALARSKGQGFARTPEERRSLEELAMAAAKKYFRLKNFDVEDVSSRRSYDLVCKRGKVELHVEVKGTTTDGDAIILTNNEVKHACNPRNACVLFVLHSIHLKQQKASGGKQYVIAPWRLLETHLTPISYTYRLR